MISYCITGFGKILVGLGVATNSTTNLIEIIDLDSSSSECKILPYFPYTAATPLGGLGPEESPVICIAPLLSSHCTIFTNGSWQPFGKLFHKIYFHPAIMSRPPFEISGSKPLLLITGGMAM